jgi:hypothetical protein
LEFYQDEDIEKICNEICNEYNLNNLVAQRLREKIEEHIILITSEDSQKKIREKEIVNRLYTEPMQRKTLKENYFEKIKKEIDEKEINNYPFTPKINEKSNNLFNRNHMRIEDRLYYEDIKKKEKRNMQRIIKDANSKEQSEIRDRSFSRLSKK